MVVIINTQTFFPFMYSTVHIIINVHQTDKHKQYNNVLPCIYVEILLNCTSLNLSRLVLIVG